MPDRSAEEQDLRATSDAVRRDADRLAELEEAKRDIDPGDPQVDRLSFQAEELGAEIADKTKAERELSQEIQPPDGRTESA